MDDSHPVDTSQLNQSRLGLVSQASMILITILFILSDILGEFWKDKYVNDDLFVQSLHLQIYSNLCFGRVDVEKRNYHDIIFRLVEIGVVLWFPCVLWNVNRPEQLWILNPKKLLKSNARIRIEEAPSVCATGMNELCFIIKDVSK